MNINDSRPWLNPTGVCAGCPYRQAVADVCRATAPVAAVQLAGDAPALQFILNVADLVLDRLHRRVERAGREIDLTPHEFDLLAYLMSHAGEVCRRKDILASVWHYRPDTKTNTLSEYIKYLRQKIDDGFEPNLIHTVHGKGYRLSADG